MPNKAARNPSRVSALLMAGSEALPLLDPVVMRNEQKSSNERDGYPGDARPPHSHPIWHSRRSKNVPQPLRASQPREKELLDPQTASWISAQHFAMFKYTEGSAVLCSRISHNHSLLTVQQVVLLVKTKATHAWSIQHSLWTGRPEWPGVVREPDSLHLCSIFFPCGHGLTVPPLLVEFLAAKACRWFLKSKLWFRGWTSANLRVLDNGWPESE